MVDVYWYSKKNVITDSKSRTFLLTRGLTNANDLPYSDHPFDSLKKKIKDMEKYQDIRSLIYYIERHPDMLRYEFDKNQNLVKIIVDPNRLFTFLDDSIQRQCNMSYGITELLKLHIFSLKKLIQVEIGNENYCSKQGFTNKLSPADTSNAAATSLDDTSLPESDVALPGSDVALPGGGHKSRRRRRHRRKPVRKTRRGRGRIRKSKAKAKSKTHRRKRHSRIRKHKKYTSRRRR